MKNKALLVSVESVYNKNAEESIQELELLCATLDIQVIDKIIQKRNKPDPVTYLGSGKIEKIKDFCQKNGIDLVVIDDEITPIQQRNIEKETNLRILDRTQVILEIFSRHATTKEGKIQIEMAKLTYELPRLRGKGLELSNPGGGIGTRGPGETILELDRRKIKERIKRLKRELDKLRTNREVSRKSRIESGYYIFSIAGYTNAGKSTLLSALADEKGILISEKLFSTLSPTVRKVKLPNSRCVLLSDTVGFISRLPHTLVEAFHSTLEEITFSDVIILLVDISDGSFKNKISASYQVLEEIGAQNKPIFIVFNKIDLVPLDYLELVRYEYPDAVFISAKKQIGFTELYKRIIQYMELFDHRERIRIKESDFGKLLKYSEYIEWDIVEHVQDEKNILVLDLKGPKSVIEKCKSEIIL
uniref:GTPase HflX n=1 Tax=Fervidobacterium nodosum TaxID=2424 RepID=A0A7C5U7W0_9BACT